MTKSRRSSPTNAFEVDHPKMSRNRRGPVEISRGFSILTLSGRIARFGDILNIEGSFVEIGPRSAFANSAVGFR